MKAELLQKLRNRQPIRLYKYAPGIGKVFQHIQLNKSVDWVCWERWYSKDKQKWIQINSCLSLKDINRIIKTKY
jgi:hypothetical protein